MPVECKGIVLGCVGAILGLSWEGSGATWGHLCEVEFVDFIYVLYVFLNMRVGCRSLTFGNVGAISALSWEDFGYMGQP